MNMFNVGEIIQHKIDKECYFLITSVDTLTREYVVMYFDEEAETTLSFSFCHKEYELASLRAE